MTLSSNGKRPLVRSFVACASIVGVITACVTPAWAAPAPTVSVGNPVVVTVVGDPASEPGPVVVQETKPTIPRGRIADPLADLAAYALDALKAAGIKKKRTEPAMAAPVAGAAPAPLNLTAAHDFRHLYNLGEEEHRGSFGSP